MRHIRTLIVTILLLTQPLAVLAQIDLSATLTHSTVLVHEPLHIRIRIRNNTAQEIRLTANDPAATLWLIVERGPSRSVRQTSPDLLNGELVIPPMESVTHSINITDSFDIRAQASYTVRPRLTWRGRTHGATTQYFDIVPGMELDQAEAALADGSGQRLYRLMTVNRNRRYDLLLRIDDPVANVCYSVIPLGSLLRVTPPQLRVDIDQNAVVLHQAAPGRYFFHQFTPNGRLLRQRTYTSESPGVGLARADNGTFVVRGATASLMQR